MFLRDIVTVTWFISHVPWCCLTMTISGYQRYSPCQGHLYSSDHFLRCLFHKALWSPANRFPMFLCCLASVWRKLYCVTECACLYVHGLHVDMCVPVYEVQKSTSRVILQAWFTLDLETELPSDLGLTGCPRLVGCELLKCTWFRFLSAQVINVYHYFKLLQEGPGSQN